VFLLGEVVIERGLGDAQAGGDLVERGAVIALEVERCGRFLQHRPAFNPVNIFFGWEHACLARTVRLAFENDSR
jgi:hypothetical protein